MHPSIFVASVTFAFTLVGALIGGKFIAAEMSTLGSGAQLTQGSLLIAFAVCPLVSGALGFAVAFAALRLFPPKK
jgi:hypothetical protein